MPVKLILIVFAAMLVFQIAGDVAEMKLDARWRFVAEVAIAIVVGLCVGLLVRRHQRSEARALAESRSDVVESDEQGEG